MAFEGATMMTWYVVRTNPKCERKAALWLRRLGLRVYVPMRRDARSPGRKGEPVIRHQPLWVGYVLVRFPPALCRFGRPAFGLLRDVYGVKELVSWSTPMGPAPVPLPDQMVARYMRRQRLGDYDGAKQLKAEREARRAKLRRGTTVRIKRGPLAALLGRIDRLDGNVARLLVDILGRDTVVDVEIDAVETVAVAKRARAA